MTPAPSSRRPSFPTAFPYPSSAFTRQDPSPDWVFYAEPRFVQHIDARCIARLGEYYAEVLPRPLPASGPSSSTGEQQEQPPRILDLCSSWTSHLPAPYSPPNAYITGLGLSLPELAANPRLARRVVHDLNASPALPEEVGQAYDAVVCSVSVDYLVRPLEVFRELARVMRPRARAHMTFSNRCFPTKVIRGWLGMGEEERCDLVACYFHFAGTAG
ncbi:hypothetical protein CALCODRAFT_453276, partial [Calocera cornea HHB12733]